MVPLAQHGPEAAQKYAGIPERYLGLTVQSLAGRAQEILSEVDAKKYAVLAAVCEVFLSTRSGPLVLWGPTGSGKTAMACALIGAAGRHVQPGFIGAAAFVDSLRDSSFTIGSVLNRFGMLVLDDLGAEYATYYSNQGIDRLVAECYESGRRLIVTTNLSEADLTTAYSVRMVDRLHEGGLWLEMSSPSFRRA